MRYFHEPETRELWSVPDLPEVFERKETVTKRRKHPKRLGWTAYATIVHIRADNWTRPDTKQWHYPVTSNPRQVFDAHYELDEVRRYFNQRHHRTPGKEISHEEFARLMTEYEAIAARNPAPTPLPPRI